MVHRGPIHFLNNNYICICMCIFKRLGPKHRSLIRKKSLHAERRESVGEAASGRLQTRFFFFPSAPSSAQGAKYCSQPDRVLRQRGQSVICFLLVSQPPLGFSCGSPLSAPSPLLTLSRTPHHLLILASGTCSRYVVPPRSSHRGQTGQHFASSRN